MTIKRIDRPLKRIYLREDYMAITSDMIEAIILYQMVCCSEQASDFDSFIAEEKERQNVDTEASDGSSLMYGWMNKSAAVVKDEIMANDSARNISRKLNSLVSKGFLLRRNNPEDKYDHEYQYRVNLIAINAELEKHGYALYDRCQSI